PTAAPPTAIPPTATAPAAPAAGQTVLQRVAAAEAALRSGQIEATIGYGEATQSSALVVFDLGDDARVPRLHITTTYAGAAGARTTERITVGDRTWERQSGGPWVAAPTRESVWHQVQVYLPRIDSAPSVDTASGPEGTVLRWYIPGYNAEMTLQVDPATGVPRQLRQVTRSTGSVLAVTYSGWNLPVEIAPPAV
ncbi:MAG: hypothetical protein ACRDJN_21565, partial [Chloroflexota bacterium]